MRHIIVARDIASAQVTSLIAKELVLRGEEVFTIAEGKAIPIFTKAGVPVDIGVPEEAASYTLDVKRLFALLRPKYVIVGLSSPIYLENAAACAANDIGIPLVAVEDIQGSSSRIDATPDIVVTADDIGVRENRKRYPRAQIVVSGSIGVKQVHPSEGVQKAMSDLRKKYDALYVFTESGKPNDPAVDEQIALLGACARMTTERFCVIPRLHPKWAKVLEEGVSLHERWSKALKAEIGAVESIEGNTEEVVVLADLTISGFSTLLTISAYNGKGAVSLKTPATMRFFTETTGLLEVPLVALGCATAVSEARDLGSIPRSPDTSGLLPFRADAVCDAL